MMFSHTLNFPAQSDYRSRIEYINQLKIFRLCDHVWPILAILLTTCYHTPSMCGHGMQNMWTL